MDILVRPFRMKEGEVSLQDVCACIRQRIKKGSYRRHFRSVEKLIPGEVFKVWWHMESITTSPKHPRLNRYRIHGTDATDIEIDQFAPIYLLKSNSHPNCLTVVSWKDFDRWPQFTFPGIAEALFKYWSTGEEKSPWENEGISMEEVPLESVPSQVDFRNRQLHWIGASVFQDESYTQWMGRRMGRKPTSIAELLKNFPAETEVYQVGFGGRWMKGYEEGGFKLAEMKLGAGPDEMRIRTTSGVYLHDALQTREEEQAFVAFLNKVCDLLYRRNFRNALKILFPTALPS